MVAETASTKAAAAAEPAIAHGGSLAEARSLFPDAPEPRIDLSTGINPVAYPLPDLPSEVLARLPEPDEIAAVEAVASSAYGAGAPETVVAGPGTQVLIGLLPLLFRAARVAVLGPTYAEHAAVWRAAGAEVTEVGSLDGLDGADVAVLCNPNNPDGRRHDPGDIAALARGRGGRLTVVDEAFADLEDPPLSLVPRLPLGGAVVLRSFGKTYGLAGLRLGFVVAAPAVADRLRRALGPWAVSGPALVAGRAALPDRDWIVATRSRLDRDVARLDALLKGAGLHAVGGTRLFRLAQGEHAPAIFARLGHAGIHVRRFADRLQDLRFGLPADNASWERLEHALDAAATEPRAPPQSSTSESR